METFYVGLVLLTFIHQYPLITAVPLFTHSGFIFSADCVILALIHVIKTFANIHF